MSKVYDHYVVSLRCDERNSKQLFFVFTCASAPTDHESHERACDNTSARTTNMRKSAQKCDLAHGVVSTVAGSAPASPMGSTYSEAAHRAIIAL